MDSNKVLFLLLQVTLHFFAGDSQVVVQVNTKKWTYFLPERFLSLSVDPLTLAAGSPLQKESLNMAKGLSPSFVRIGGIGTHAVYFGKQLMMNSTTVTEEQWESVNKFARTAGLDIIASLNANLRAQSGWDSRNSQELIAYSHKKNFDDAWQLGYDLQGYNASGFEIGKDLEKLMNVLDRYPNYANSPIFGPDITSVTGAKQIHLIKDILTTAGSYMGSVILQPNFPKGAEPEDSYELMSSMINELDTYVWNKEIRIGNPVHKKPIWIAEGTTSEGSFDETVKLVKRLGNAAKLGVQVYLRKAGINTLKFPTSDFWFSLLYKNLVGQGVLENKVATSDQNGVHTFSHCTASIPQDKSVLDTDWNYEKGAITVFGVNESPESVEMVLKATSKEEPLHIYVLTSAKKNEHSPVNTWVTLLNGQELTLSPAWDLPVLSPKVKPSSKSSTIILPGKSIFFIVMPNSKVSACLVPPLATPDLTLAELTKRLRLSPQRKTEMSDDLKTSSAPLEEEQVYVRFTKKKPSDFKVNIMDNQKMDLMGQNLMKTLFSKLVPQKDKVRETSTEDEMAVKYITFNENSFLNKLAEGIKEELKEEDKTEPDETNRRYPALNNAIANSKLSSQPPRQLTKVSEAESNPPQLKILYRSRRSSNEDDSQVARSSDGSKSIETVLKQIIEHKKSGMPMNQDMSNIVQDLGQVKVTYSNADSAMEEYGKDNIRSTRHIEDGSIEEIREQLEEVKEVLDGVIESRNEGERTEVSDAQTDTGLLESTNLENGDVATPKVKMLPSLTSVVQMTPNVAGLLNVPVKMYEINSDAPNLNMHQLTGAPLLPSDYPSQLNSPISIDKGISMQQTPIAVSSPSLNDYQIVPAAKSKDNYIQKISQTENDQSKYDSLRTPNVLLPTVPSGFSRPVDNIPLKTGNEEKLVVKTDSQQTSSPINAEKRMVQGIKLIDSVNVKPQDETIPRTEVSTLKNSQVQVEPINEDDGVYEPSVKVSRQINVTPNIQVDTIPAPPPEIIVTPKPVPVPPIKEPVIKPPIELIEGMKKLKEKIKELKEKYEKERNDMLVKLKAQMESIQNPVKVDVKDDVKVDVKDDIKSVVRRREAELKEWLKKFDAKESTVSVNLPSANDKVIVRPRRLSLFTEGEGLDLEKLFQEEPTENKNLKRSPEMSNENQFPDTISAGPPNSDSVKTGDSESSTYYFPLDGETQGIVYNNKIYPAKLFGYVERPNVEKDGKESTMELDVNYGSGDENNDGETELVNGDELGSNSEFIPLVVIPPGESGNIRYLEKRSSVREKRSAISDLEEQFKKIKEDIFPKIRSFIKNFNDNPPWKRDLEQSSRTRRSVNNQKSSLTQQKILHEKSHYERKETSEDSSNYEWNSLEALDNEILNPIKKLSYLNSEKKTNSVQPNYKKNHEVVKNSDEIGYCEEVGTSTKSVIIDPFLKTEAEAAALVTEISPGEEAKENPQEESENNSFSSAVKEGVKQFFISIGKYIGAQFFESS